MQCIVEPERNDAARLRTEANVACYKDTEDWKVEVRWHNKLWIEKIKHKTQESNKEVQIDVKLEGHRDKFIEIMSPF